MLALGIALLVLGGLAIVGFWSAVFTARKGQSVSSIPLLGGGFALAGCALIPAIGWKLGLLALVIDPGCWFLALPFVFVARRLRRYGSTIRTRCRRGRPRTTE